MTSYDADVLAQQLSALGRDLQNEILILGELEEHAVDAEAVYRELQDQYEDEQAKAFLSFTGTVEVRKMETRLATADYREKAAVAYISWNQAKGKLRVQQANLQAIHKRVDIGRSLLSREKSLISLVSSGIDV